jgi:hypothetical protein
MDARAKGNRGTGAADREIRSQCRRTARLPMSPPGKNNGRTTNESVVIAGRPEIGSTTA